MSYEPVVQALADAGVEFVLIGGWAAILHGSSFMTNDLDICYCRRSDNVKRLAAILAPLHPRPRGFPAGLPFVWDAVTLRNSTLFTLDTDAGEIDLLGEVSGVGDFEQVKANSVVTSAFGRDIRILDLPALIAAKRAAGREKDLRVIPELEALLEAQEPE